MVGVVWVEGVGGVCSVGGWWVEYGWRVCVCVVVCGLLFFSLAVVVDRRDDKDSDTGGFELAYKQVQ